MERKVIEMFDGVEFTEEEKEVLRNGMCVSSPDDRYSYFLLADGEVLEIPGDVRYSYINGSQHNVRVEDSNDS